LTVDLTALFKEHHEALFRYVSRLVGEPDVAADAVQEAFVRYAEKPPAAGNTRAWLYRVASNFAIENRRTARRREVLLEAGAARMPLADAPLSADAKLEREQERRRVHAALQGLSERERTVLLMREEGFSHKEIAEAVGTTTGSVGTLIARALDKLARELQLDEENAA
jgi:RNA polymerase sigma factor (sigma-70 family)